jgi:hypothetical protein
MAAPSLGGQFKVKFLLTEDDKLIGIAQDLGLSIPHWEVAPLDRPYKIREVYPNHINAPAVIQLKGKKEMVFRAWTLIPEPPIYKNGITINLGSFRMHVAGVVFYKEKGEYHVKPWPDADRQAWMDGFQEWLEERNKPPVRRKAPSLGFEGGGIP